MAREERATLNARAFWPLTGLPQSADEAPERSAAAGVAQTKANMADGSGENKEAGWD